MRAIGVRHRFRRRDPEVLREVEVELQPGQAVQIQGSNGSGKTTLLRILGGMAAPAGGRIVGRPTPVGYVPDRLPDLPRFSVREYLLHCCRMRGATTAAGRRQVDTELDGWGLLGVADTQIRRVSRGNRQKVVLSQALLAIPGPGRGGRPGMLVLDEPWTALDGGAQRALSHRIVAARDAGTLVVYADHQESGGDLRPCPDLAYAVVGGRVSPSSVPDRSAGQGNERLARMLVELAEPVPAGLLDPGSGGGAGDDGGDRAGDGVVRVVVPAPRCDEFLRRALAAGASVRRVVPAPEERS